MAIRLFTPLLLIASLGLAQQAPLIIDTDAGSDDILAIAFLLSQPGIKIEAITVANGMAHVGPGMQTIAHLLKVAGRAEIEIFGGRSVPLRGNAEFPGPWRKSSDELLGTPHVLIIKLPLPAAWYLEQLKTRRSKVRILALGPLTNIAEALERDRAVATAIQEIIIMGGAIRVPGNSPNKTAEWNMFIDPYAARIVFRSGVHIRLVPLDATNQVPIGPEFLREFQSAARSPLGKIAAQILATDRAMIDQGAFYAWDPLAAVALVKPSIVKTAPLDIDIRQDAPESGRTIIAAGSPNATVALEADAARFRKLFLEAFQK